MSKNEMREAKAAGFTIPAKAMFGSDKYELRKKAMAAGAKFDSKDMVWVFPNDEVCSEFEVELGLTKEVRKDIPWEEPERKPERKPMPTEMPDQPAKSPADMLAAATMKKQNEAAPARKEGSKGLLRLPPSLLIGGSVSVPGDVRYQTLAEEVETLDEGEIKRRERTKTTKKTVRDPEGYEAAHKLAGQIRGRLKKLCQSTPFGWMCRADKADEIDAFISEAKQECKEFNTNSKYHFVRFTLIKGKIDSDDEAAAKDIAYEMQRLFGEMRLALEACDVKRIRELAVKGLALKPMFEAPEQSVIQDAINSARAEARRIVKEVGAKGETIETVKDEIDTSIVEVARLSFLDYEAPDEMPSADKLINEDRYKLDTEEAVELEAPAPMDKGQFDLDFSTN